MQLKLGKKQVKKIKKALKKHYKVNLALRATASTAGGATTTTTAVIQIKG